MPESVRVVVALLQAGLTIATCESLTGGLLGATITDVPGASGTYVGGLVTYASRLKTQLVGVDEALVAREGVVNAATAEQMALGARDLLGADLAVSCTGVAGPDPQDGQPVGRVFLGLAHADGVVTRRLDLTGGRAEIRAATVAAALSLVAEHLRGE